MSRNILNTWAVDIFLANIGEPDDSPAIRAWLDRVARRWILKEFQAVGEVVRVRPMTVGNCGWVDVRWTEGADSSGVTTRMSEIPRWLEGAPLDGVLWLDMAGPSARELAARLNAVVGYFHELESSGPTSRLERIALPDAVAAALRLRRTGLRREPVTCGNTLMAFDDGYRVVLLSSGRALAEEGERMRHCVGDYLERVSRGTDILSLRDPRDLPHVTIEVRGGRKVYQVKGKANAPVAPRYRPYVIDFVHRMGLLLAGDRANLGITYRPFDWATPQGWPRQNRLRQLVQDDIAGRSGSLDELEIFYEDARAVIDTMSDDSWAWFSDLFRGPGGRYAWLDQDQWFEIGDERFAVLDLRFPIRLHWLLRDHARSRRSQALRRHLLDELASLLFQFCRQDSSALLFTDGCEHLAHIDFSRLRHEHQERLRRRLAEARRKLRRGPAVLRARHELVARWEHDRRTFTRRLHEENRAYL